MINFNFLYNDLPLEEILNNNHKFTENHHIENISFIKEFLSEKEYIITKTSGSTGVQKEISIKKEYMVNSAFMTGEYFNLKEKISALLCISSNFIAGKMMLVRALILGWNLEVIDPCSNPLEILDKEIDFIALTPMQFLGSKKFYYKSKNILLGGSPISKNLENEIKELPNTNFFLSYGMTETVSHIAIRNIKIQDYFNTLPNVKISNDKNNCLVINAPKICGEEIITKDIIEIISENKFKFLGRLDNMINSGGIKIFPEKIEKSISLFIKNRLFFISSKKDKVLGEKVILLIEGRKIDIDRDIFKKINKYEIPKEIIFIPKFVLTETGKIKRKETIKLL